MRPIHLVLVVLSAGCVPGVGPEELPLQREEEEPSPAADFWGAVDSAGGWNRFERSGAADLSVAATHAYLELRTYTEEDDGSVEYRVSESVGEACSDATDLEACLEDQAAVGAAPHPGFDGCWYEQYQAWRGLLWNRGDVWGEPASSVEVAALLDPTEVRDVAFLVRADELGWTGQGGREGGWRDGEGGLELVIVGLHRAVWEGSEERWYHVAVRPDGRFEVLRTYTEVLETGDGYSDCTENRLLVFPEG